MCGTEANNWFGGKKDYPYLEQSPIRIYTRENLH